MPEPFTVTEVGPPLMCVEDGADTAHPCAVVARLSLVVGDRVTADARTPQMPLVTAKENA